MIAAHSAGRHERVCRDVVRAEGTWFFCFSCSELPVCFSCFFLFLFLATSKRVR